MQNMGRIRGTEGVNHIAENQRQKGLRQPIQRSRDRPDDHQPGIQPIPEREKPVERHLLISFSISSLSLILSH